MSNSGIFRQEAIKFQSDRLLGQIILNEPLSLRLLSIGLFIFMGLLISYLALGRYTQTETSSGYLKSSTGLINVFSTQNRWLWSILRVLPFARLFLLCHRLS